MRTKLILLAIVLQFAVLAWMAGQREWILRTGQTVWLRTAPVDPRDLFRGDYVRLNYEIAGLPVTAFGPALKQYLADEAKRHGSGEYWRGREIVVYTALRVDTELAVAEVAGVDFAPPASGPFIQGRVRPSGRMGPGGVEPADLAGVSYGIDAYYVQQGKGRELERGAPAGVLQGSRVPFEMQVALGRDGTAVLKGYRWSQLAMETRVQEGPRPTTDSAAAETPARRVVQVTLRNAATVPVAVVLPPDLRTLHLRRQVSSPWGGRGEDIGVPRLGLPPLTDADVRVLQPQEAATVEVDLGRPEWAVVMKAGAAPQPLAQAMASVGVPVCLAYEAPAAEACRGLGEAERIWRGTLLGSPFNREALTGR